MVKPRYHRILLKLSGEALGKRGKGLNDKLLQNVVKEIRALRLLGVELAIVIGGGNFWRKRHGTVSITPETSDYLGMLGTGLNALALRDALIKAGLKVNLQCFVIKVPQATEVNAGLAQQALRAGKVVVFGGGTGKPYVTTDTAAAQRARDIKADIIFKASQVDGVYTADPGKNARARKYTELTFTQAIKNNLGVMDNGAFHICQKARIPVLVFKWGKGALVRAVQGKIGTLVKA